MKIVKEPVGIAKCNCGAMFEDIAISETYVGPWGARFIECPYCGNSLCVDDLPDTEISIDEIIFPQHFYETSKYAVPVSDKRIAESVDEISRSLSANDASFTGFGNFMGFVINDAEGAKRFYSHKYYEGWFPSEIPEDPSREWELHHGERKDDIGDTIKSGIRYIEENPNTWCWYCIDKNDAILVFNMCGDSEFYACYATNIIYI